MSLRVSVSRLLPSPVERPSYVRWVNGCRRCDDVQAISEGLGLGPVGLTVHRRIVWSCLLGGLLGFTTPRVASL